jgi:CDP-glucose 4,6-dehydratase
MVRDYLYVVDGALAYLQLAEQMAAQEDLAGQAFNFSAEEPLTVLEMVQRLQEAAGTALEPLIVNDAAGEIPAQHLSAAKARAVLGWAPDYPLERGLDETVDYYRAVLAR